VKTTEEKEKTLKTKKLKGERNHESNRTVPLTKGEIVEGGANFPRPKRNRQHSGGENSNLKRKEKKPQAT